MTDTPPAPRTGRVLRIALVLSLTANLVILGLVVGASFGRHRGGPPEAISAGIGFVPFISALPREERRAFGKALSERAGALSENREAFRREFDKLLELVRAEPFDVGAVQAVLESQQQRLSERQDLGRELFLERLAAMSQDERAAFADALAERMKRGPKGWHRDREERSGD